MGQPSSSGPIGPGLRGVVRCGKPSASCQRFSADDVGSAASNSLARFAAEARVLNHIPDVIQRRAGRSSEDIASIEQPDDRPCTAPCVGDDDGGLKQPRAKGIVPLQTSSFNPSRSSF